MGRSQKANRASRVKWEVCRQAQGLELVMEWSKIEFNSDSYLRMALSEQDNRLLTTEQGK